MNSIFVWTYFMIICCYGQAFNRDYLNDFSFLVADVEQEPINQNPALEKIRQKTGSELILKCKSHGCHRNSRNRNQWEFMPCKLCQRKQSLEWTKIQQKKLCVSTLRLKNVTNMNNGLYRCVSRSVATVTYDVDIIELSKYEGEPPKVIEIIPLNSTIKLHTNLLVQCRVSSNHVPVIIWLKLGEKTLYDIEYLGKYYTLIKASHYAYQMPNQENIYVSKLNIQNTTHTDTGIYFCVAVTELGRNYSNFTVKVISGFKNYEQPTSFSVLFLIPLPFILIPVIAWLCYYKNKNMKNKQMDRNKHELSLMEFNENVFENI